MNWMKLMQMDIIGLDVLDGLDEVNELIGLFDWIGIVHMAMDCTGMISDGAIEYD